MRFRGLLAIVVAGTLGAGAGAIAQSVGAEADRLSGSNRIDTAIAISQHAFPDGSLEIYITNQNVNPDALAGGALTKGPILLVPQCGTLPAAVAAEIERLAPFRVYALGGPGPVCDDMLNQAAAAAPAPADRAPQTVTRTMSGEGSTSAFELNGGSYLLTYDFGADCFYGPFLEAIDGQGRDKSLSSGDGPTTGEVFVHNVVPGEYAFDMITGNVNECPWTLTLSNE